MAKSKYFELIFVFVVIFFQQFVLAQAPPQNSPTKIDELEESETLGSWASRLDQRALAFLNQANLREIDRIKWPEDPELEGPSKVKYQDLGNLETASEKIRVSLQNCQKQAAQYESEVQANYGIKKGTISEIDVVCERLAIAMKRVKNPNNPAFNVVGKFVMNKLDSALFIYLESSEYERIKIYQKSILGRLGLPVKYMEPVLQVMILLLLALNGFLAFKTIS